MSLRLAALAAAFTAWFALPPAGAAAARLGMVIELQRRSLSASRADHVAGGLVGGDPAGLSGRTSARAFSPIRLRPRHAFVAALPPLLLLGVPLPAVLATACLAVVAPLAWRRHRQRALAHARSRAVVDVGLALASLLRAGRPPESALLAAAPAGGPLAPALVVAARAAGHGADVTDELVRAAGTTGCVRLLVLARTWAATQASGARAAAVIDRLADTFDADDQLAADLAAATSGPRATMLMLAALPLLGVGLGHVIGADPLRLLLHRPLGWALLTAAGALDAAGAMWMHRLVRGALRVP